MTRPRLDRNLLDRIAAKLQKKRQAINVKVSQKAARLGISSEAALVLLAKELGIGTAHYQRKLDAHQQAEIRGALMTELPTANKSVDRRKQRPTARPISKQEVLKAAVEYLLSDAELRERCGDLLLAKSHFDRAINQATLVLEERIRNKSQPREKLVGENLVGYAFNADPAKTVLRVSTNRDEQRGFTFMIKGVVPAFRNPTHHHITGSFTREEALRVCGFIDVALRIVDASVKVN